MTDQNPSPPPAKTSWRRHWAGARRDWYRQGIARVEQNETGYGTEQGMTKQGRACQSKYLQSREKRGNCECMTRSEQGHAVSVSWRWKGTTGPVMVRTRDGVISGPGQVWGQGKIDQRNVRQDRKKNNMEERQGGQGKAQHGTALPMVPSGQ